MSSETHHVVITVGKNPQHGVHNSYGSGKYLATARFGTPDGAVTGLRELAAAGTKDTAAAQAVRALLREARRRG
jgi:hypothetical protein